MTPWQLAKDSEFSHQAALFCWCAYAQSFGFDVANDQTKWTQAHSSKNKVVELAYYHSIPNGTRSGDLKSRQIEGGMMKASGTKAGVLDTFWPLKRGSYCGLYIELKKPSLKSAKNPVNGCSDEQNAFGAYVTSQGYIAKVCYSWLEAAEVLQWYYSLKD